MKELAKGFIKNPLDIIGLIIFFYLFSIFAYAQDFSPIVKEETFKTHLRWNVYAPKNQFIIEKGDKKVLFKSLDDNLLNDIKKSIDMLTTSPFKSKYIKEIKYLAMGPENSSPALEVTLTEEKVDVFNFYRDTEGKFIIDFWRKDEKDSGPSKGERKISEIEKNAPQIKEEVPAIPKKISMLPKKEDLKGKNSNALIVASDASYSGEEAVSAANSDFRDFRYGANFVWDYSPLGPSFKGFVNTSSKTAEVFYPIKDRPYDKDEVESHLQLAINLYRKGKWGLMYKSLKLFEAKYENTKYFDVIEYLKSNALLKENINKGEVEPVKMAVQMYATLAEKSKNYELRKGLWRYLITYYVDKKDYVMALNFSKKLYVACKENFDYEEATLSAEAILFNLANLGQIERITEITKDKTITKILPNQTILAYQFYTTMGRGDSKEVIKLFEQHEKSLARPVHEVILFNTAESYFRQARFQEAIKLFDEFLSNYSFHSKAQEARLRIALSYEILERNPLEVAELYLEAINRSPDFKVSYEAKLRYVALLNARQKNSSNADKEKLVLLNLKDGQDKILNKKIIHLLWLVRLRVLIGDKKFDQALSYLNAVEMVNLLPAEKRVFEADGAEIIYGVILDLFKSNNYSKAVKIWEIYREKYIDKVANDPYLNFIIGKSYAKLGLYDGFEKNYASFKRVKDSPSKTFPIWFERNSKISTEETLVELDILKNMNLKNWDLARKAIDDLDKMNPLNSKIDYYRALIEYQNKNYKESISYFENFIARKNGKEVFDPEEIAELIHSYADAVYSTNDLERFKKIAKALIEDTEKANKSKIIAKYRERVYYLYIETLAGENNAENNLLLEAKIKNFFSIYKDTIYKDRLTFLLGVAYVNNKKEDEGKKVLGDLVKNKETSSTIKEMAKSELVLLEIKSKTI